MSDSLVYDMSQMSEGSPQVFVKRDWLSLLDQQNGNYLGNQSVIDTSQLSNSNKYMAYREGYLAVPLTLAVQGTKKTTSSANANGPQSLLQGGDNIGGSSVGAPGIPTAAVGLKNWFGHLVHSMTLDYAGTTIIQNTPLTSIWTHFGLMTTMSMGDVLMNGSTIGFYPDNAKSFGLNLTNTQLSSVPATGTYPTLVTFPAGGGRDVTNLVQFTGIPNVPGACNTYSIPNLPPTCNNVIPLDQSNPGMFKRSQYWSFSKEAIAGGYNNYVASATTQTTYGQAYSVALADNAVNNLRLSAVVKNQLPTDSVAGYLQYGILAIIKLKDLHPFFSQVPLLKGVFMRLTLNLNQPSFTISQRAPVFAQANTGTGANINYGIAANPSFDIASMTSPLGGVNPVLVACQSRMLTSIVSPGDEYSSSVNAAEGFLYNGKGLDKFGTGNNLITISLNVGNKTTNPAITQGDTAANIDQSIQLYVPAYTFNPTFEEAYLGSPVKTVVYTDIYQYTTPIISGNGATFNQLLTNGIANIKSILVFPVYDNMVDKENYTYQGSSGVGAGVESIAKSTSPLLSPFDTCPSTTSPLCHIANFNVVVAGQNMIYNTQKYAYEEFLNNLSGCNSINANLVNGLTSGLIGQSEFMASQCLYYVNTSRMLPVDEVVPKSVSITGQNQSSQDVRYICFIEYGVQVSVDVLTGSRV